jgi:hypothetical protein
MPYTCKSSGSVGANLAASGERVSTINGANARPQPIGVASCASAVNCNFFTSATRINHLRHHFTYQLFAAFFTTLIVTTITAITGITTISSLTGKCLQ